MYRARVATADVPHSARHWAELDLLRALAGALMVVNHAGVAWLPDHGERGGLDGALTFVGSLAPVLFFTVTGIGRGIQSAPGGASRPFRAPLLTAFILTLADATLWLSPTRHLGMDFLGFIALSTVVVEIVNRTRWPAAVAAVSALVCLLLRYVVAPRVGLRLGTGVAAQGLNLLVGKTALIATSYPICPWLAYPLFGSLVGRFAARHADRIRATRGRCASVLAVTAAVGLGLCVVMYQHHATFFRWGAMSFAYCILGFAAVLAGISLVLAVVRGASAGAIGALSLPGLASFVLVPVHYAVIAGLHPESLMRPGVTFPLALLVLVPVVFGASRWIDRRMKALASHRRPLSTVILLTTTVALLFQIARADGPLPLRLVTQLLACGLFAFLSPRRASRMPTPLPSNQVV